uniref:Uncharacterized protein n=1 Tax=Romanomermis culicivorax TaxID=13658 RepID=A0A915IKF6_ROMCU
MESAFGEHMIKCVILDDDNKDQCILSTDFLALPDIHQWVTSNVFPTSTATIPDVIVQPLPTNSVTAEVPIETAIVNITNGQCTLLFVNNTPNSIKLRPNQLLAVAKHALGFTKSHIDCQVATAAADRNLTNHEPAALNKSLPCHTDQRFNLKRNLFYSVATPEDWTVLFSLIDSDHTIVISFDGADDWVGIYTLLGTQFWTDRQKKNKDAIFKAIHFDAYRMIRNINISTLQYELAWKIGLIPEKRRLKATMSAMWAFDVKFDHPQVPGGFAIFQQFLHTDVLTYATLDMLYPILLFLAFSRYSFVPEAYNTPVLFPQDSLDATEIDHFVEMIIVAFHNVTLTDVLPSDAIDKVYPTISQVALPAIMGMRFFLHTNFSCMIVHRLTTVGLSV